MIKNLSIVGLLIGIAWLAFKPDFEPALVIIASVISLLTFVNEETRISRSQSEKISNLYGVEDELLENVHKVTEKINNIIKLEHKSKDQITVLNQGLDLQFVIPWLISKIEDEKYKDTLIIYKGLIVNPDYEKLFPLINDPSNVRASYVNSSLEQAKSISNYPRKKLQIEIKSYSNLPHYHGFIINETHLFIGFTQIVNGKIMGGNYPYLYIRKDKTSKWNQHLFNMFISWFNYTWETSTSKVKIIKK